MNTGKFVFQTRAVPMLLAGRIMFADDPAPLRKASPNEDEERVTTSKLDRLADELRALGIDF